VAPDLETSVLGSSNNNSSWKAEWLCGEIKDGTSKMFAADAFVFRSFLSSGFLVDL